MATRINPGGGKGQERMWRNAVHLAVKRYVDGSDVKALTRLAEKLVEKGMSGDIAALKEVGDRLDGRPTQAVDMNVTEPITCIERVIVDALPKPEVIEGEAAGPATNGSECPLWVISGHSAPWAFMSAIGG